LVLDAVEAIEGVGCDPNAARELPDGQGRTEREPEGLTRGEDLLNRPSTRAKAGSPSVGRIAGAGSTFQIGVRLRKPRSAIQASESGMAAKSTRNAIALA